ncbi:heparan-alpha-glucosaminide N-acetyltransferase domain-containing protein [Niabella aurantiaca]|uniref:heparan-alpha-glucosaminide N-acetyltransferase domain-containing protein n=1 Tax=Niabella aurantiaca TaxID=379900 RepID=UPI0003624AE5|nr:heparan-alpha-glucosaminide N-acetyltransferase domain-containing protein [Niabella aurantiaca]
MLTQYQRKGFSLARGFVVLVMPAIHTVLLYSMLPVKQGPLGMILGFLAETSGAPLFMLLMGLFLALGREKPFGYIFKRFLMLLAAGYLLNSLKFLVPYGMGWIPLQFLIDNGLPINEKTPAWLFLTGDILQFAAIAYVCCALLKKLIKSIIGYGVIFLVVLLVAPFTWELHSNGILSMPLALLNGTPPYTFFPLFPWLLYPLAGLITGALLFNTSNVPFNRLLCFLAIGFTLAGYALALTEPAHWKAEFYRLGRGGTLFHIGLALAWVWLFQVLAKKLPDNYLFHLLQWLSDHILLVYILQWIVIFWCFPLFGYNRLQTFPSVLALCATTSASFLILFFALTVSKKIRQSYEKA